MGVTNSNKVINQDRIDCDGSLRVTLAITAAPPAPVAAAART